MTRLKVECSSIRLLHLLLYPLVDTGVYSDKLLHSLCLSQGTFSQALAVYAEQEIVTDCKQ